ncbi:MAG: redox-sensing transcriptional repressor Rex [Acidobacteriota bacterium]|nr:redox-sensing transcriptional repressor Rex [Acidobacteriota bacterium]MDH3528912.1 redox-sensing transcriptional repressor Rex [Acidobacteriota bacterium]
MKTEKISELTTNRLSIYLRCLNELSAEGAKTISSGRLAKRFHLNSAQIRKDLACFGEFGVRGVGYYIADLKEQITKILGLDHKHRVAIIGAGRLGMALTDYYGFTQTNFEVAALFDADEEKIGSKVGKVKVFDLKNFERVIRKEDIDVAVIAVPAQFAQSVLETVAKSGIKAVMNFAPTPLRFADDIKVKTIDLTISLESLSYFLAKPQND